MDFIIVKYIKMWQRAREGAAIKFLQHTRLPHSSSFEL
jgi:hypothetical protein